MLFFKKDILQASLSNAGKGWECMKPVPCTVLCLNTRNKGKLPSVVCNKLFLSKNGFLRVLDKLLKWQCHKRMQHNYSCVSYSFCSYKSYYLLIWWIISIFPLQCVGYDHFPVLCFLDCSVSCLGREAWVFIGNTILCQLHLTDFKLRQLTTSLYHAP